MAMTRAQRHHAAAVAKFQSGRNQPPTRKQIENWLAPINKALNELKSGYVDSYRGYAITRIKSTDEDFARIDFCLNGFLCLTDRLMPEIDTSALRKISNKLANGVLLEASEVDAAFATLKPIADRLKHFTRAQLKDAAATESIRIELEALGILEAA